jgi:hypothetical protein
MSYALPFSNKYSLIPTKTELLANTVFELVSYARIVNLGIESPIELTRNVLREIPYCPRRAWPSAKMEMCTLVPSRKLTFSLFNRTLS